jgi:hypothetical protein
MTCWWAAVLGVMVGLAAMLFALSLCVASKD